MATIWPASRLTSQKSTLRAWRNTSDAPDCLAEISTARIVPLSSRRDSEAVPKSDRSALLDAIERAIRFGEAA